MRELSGVAVTDDPEADMGLSWTDTPGCSVAGVYVVEQTFDRYWRAIRYADETLMQEVEVSKWFNDRESGKAWCERRWRELEATEGRR